MAPGLINTELSPIELALKLTDTWLSFPPAKPSVTRLPKYLLLVTVDGQPVTVIAFTVANGSITAIRALTDPDRLAQIVPSWVA